MTYAEYLLENGATQDEVKVLDTAPARRAYEKMQAQVAEAAQERQKAADLVKRNQEWATQVETQNQAYLKERDSAQIEAAAAKARIAKMSELGLIEVAERMEPGSTRTTTTTEPGTWDPKVLDNYVDRNTLLSVAEQEGNAIAIAQDIAYEHAQLFGNDPAKRLNFRALRQEAKERKIPFDRLWEEKYNVAAAREAASAKAQSDRDAKIAADAITKYKSEHSSTNPLTTTPQISSTPFTGRVPSSTTVDKPWLKSDGEKESARVAKVMPKLEQAGLVQ